MPHKKTLFLFMLSGLALILSIALWLATAAPVSAQCGSQASSCKNCHEVQAELPVNNDGTGWHQSHAFGDFCYICHAGNNQATDMAASHEGMVSPLTDINASCQQCHPADLTARAQVYATTLGVTLGSGSAAGSGSEPAATETALVTSSGSEPCETTLVTESEDVVDYVQRYNEIVLGKHPTNWGNVILIAMIVMLALGGGGFVILREKLVKVSFGDTKKVEGEYPGDVVDMLPVLAGLKPQMRKSLKNILNNSQKTEKVLNLIEAIVSDDEQKE